MDDAPFLEPSELAEALVSAFPMYLQQRLELLGIDTNGPVAEAVETAVADLAGSLAVLAKLSPQDQNKSPLELVRDATVPITEALSARRETAAYRDKWAVEVHPEDIYDLYPASARDLGEEAWQLHLAWGIDKARVVAGMVPASPEPSKPSSVRLPAVALFGIAPEDRDELMSELGARGYRSLVWRNPAALAVASVERPVLVFVELRHPVAHDAIRSLAEDGIRVVAVTDQVNDLAMAGVMAIGAEEVVELGRVIGRLDRLLPRLV